MHARWKRFLARSRPGVRRSTQVRPAPSDSSSLAPPRGFGAKTFRWQRDVKFLQDAIAADQRLGEVDRLAMARLLREAEQR